MTLAPRGQASLAQRAGREQGMTLAVRWAVSRSAISASRPDLIPPGIASKHEPELVLTIVAETDDAGKTKIARAHAWLHDPATGRKPVIESAPSLEGAAWLTDWERGLIHAEIPGWAGITARRADDGFVLLYARTSVLERLGLAGGRYEMPESSAS